MTRIDNRKKMWVVMPLLIFPFLTMAFWALGGGDGNDSTNSSAITGLNLQLPDAQPNADSSLNKLQFYERAAKDSLRLQEWMRNDPYFRRDTSVLPGFNELEMMHSFRSGAFNPRLDASYSRESTDPSDELLTKLNLLQEQITASNDKEIISGRNREEEDNLSRQIDRLETLIRTNTSSATENPEMKQLDGTLDKILDIQHPQRVKERQQAQRKINDGNLYAIRSEAEKDTSVSGFYGYSDPKELDQPQTIEAVIAMNQTIVHGSVLKFRTISNMYINDKLVPPNTIISGLASLEGERLIVEISSIRSGKNLYPVKLEVFDMDGMPGIYVPGTINREVAKESLNNSLSLADVTTLDPSLKAQATATGVGALKSLIGKKAKMVRVQVKGGYKVLFKNKNQTP